MRSILSIFLILFSVSSFAQTAHQNLQKYWWYRYQLVNDYMKIGLNCGESIPGNNRHFDGSWEFPRDQNGNLMGGNHLHWGDATIALGQYLAVLATEFKILQLSGLSTIRTKYEIYHALMAYNRLDIVAEERCRNFENTRYCQNINPQSGDLNGFFIRDDVPENFEEAHHKHFNRPGLNSNHKVGDDNLLIGGAMSCIIGRSNYEYGSINNDYQNGNTLWSQQFPNVPQYPDEMSQDQVVQIYSGLALLIKLLDNSSYNGLNLRETAEDAILRLVKYCKRQNNEWIIRNPIDGNCVYGISPSSYSNRCSNGGGLIFMNAPAMAEGLLHIGATWTSSQLIDILNMKISMNPGHESIYQLTKNQIFCGTGKTANANQVYFPALFTAYSNTYTIPFPLPHNPFNKKNVTPQFLTRLCGACDFRWLDVPLIYRLINGGPLLPVQSMGNNLSYEEILDVAPPCYMYNFSKLESNNDWFHREWSSPNRLAEFYKRDKEGLYETFHGIPYMLLFNLTVLAGGYSVSINNPYYVENMSTTFGVNIGTHATPLPFHTYEYLASTSHLTSNANVTFRNAKQINLNPGFKTEHGAVFLAYVKDYNCENDPFEQNITPSENYDPFIPTDVFDVEMGEYEFPEDTTEYYEAPDSIITADSLNLVDSVLNSGDSFIIFQFNKLFNPDTTGGGQSKPGRKSDASTSIQNHSVKNNTFSDRIRIYPNPTTGAFHIEIPQRGNYTIRVMNMLGSTVYEGNMTDEQKKSIILDNNLPPGNYTLHISDDGLRHVERITLIK